MATQTSLLATIWTLFGLALLATVVRVIVRLRIQRKFQAEDYFAILAFLLLAGMTAVVAVMVLLFGTEQDYLEELAANPEAAPPFPFEVMEERTVLALKLMFSQMLLFWSTIWASKTSLLVFFQQLVVGLPKYMLVWWAVVLLVLLSYVGCMVSNFVTCVPLTKYWGVTGCSDPYNVHRSDISIRVASALDVFADLLIMILPLRFIWTLRISITQKVALACLFSLGMVVVVFAFVRLYNVTKAASEGVIDEAKLADAPLILSLWSQIEAAMSVIVANLPALRSFMRRQLGGSNYGTKELGSSSGGSKKMCRVHYTGESDPEARSKAVFRHQSVELASLDGNEDEVWPITGKAAAMLGVVDRTQITKHIEPGDDGILATTVVKVTRSPRQDHHMRADSGENTFRLQLRPDLA